MPRPPDVIQRLGLSKWKNQRASISLVQRHLRIGYNRSARLIEAMEKAGLVSTMDGRGGREVLMKKPAE